MGDVDVIAVVGSCGPERLRYAKRLAKMMEGAFYSAAGLAGSPDPVKEAAILASWGDPARAAIVEFPAEAVATDVIGTLTEESNRVRLRALVCIVDAAHILEDLYSEEYVPLRDDDSGIHSALVARAELAIRHIEYASVVVLVNWAGLDTASLATFMALVSSIAPNARMQLQRAGFQSLGELGVYTAEQDRAGWTCVLNEGHAPHMTDRRVTSFHYEEPRPLHPGRLAELLDRMESGVFGRIVRSAGFCRLATRPTVVAHWEHVGRVITFAPVAVDARLGHDEEFLAVGQDLAFIGLDLDVERLGNALGEASLTNAELEAGPAAWGSFPDPFPAWATARPRSE